MLAHFILLGLPACPFSLFCVVFNDSVPHKKGTLFIPNKVLGDPSIGFSDRGSSGLQSKGNSRV